MWRETEGDGEGDITRLVAKDADTSDSICQRAPGPNFCCAESGTRNRGSGGLRGVEPPKFVTF